MYDVHQAGLEGCFVFGEPVLLPGVVVDVHVEVVAHHTPFEETDACFVIRFLFKLEGPTIFDKFSEFRGVASAELLEWDLDFLLFDGGVLFVLVSARQSLPRERPFDQVEQDVADCFQVVSSGLLDTFVRVDRGIARSSG